MRWSIRWALGSCLMLGPPVTGVAQGSAQGSLAEMAERVRQAWLAHDAPGVVGQSATLVLQIPGADPSAPLDRAHGVELVRRYMHAAVERGLRLGAVQEAEPGMGYAELERRYAVVRTSDVRRETIFLTFHKVGEEWLLAELRSVP